VAPTSSLQNRPTRYFACCADLKATEISSWRILYLYIISLPVQLSLGLAAYVNFPGHRHLLVQENSLLENLTAVFYLIAALMGLELFRRNKNRLQLLLPTVLGLVGFLDELQWGERLLNLSMPIVAGNKINAVHDFVDVARETYSQQLTVVRLSMLAAPAGIALLGLPYFRVLFKMGSLILRRPVNLCWALFVCLGIAAVCLDQIFDTVSAATVVEEVLEMNAALILVVITLKRNG
jgi:hypothetical protein